MDPITTPAAPVAPATPAPVTPVAPAPMAPAAPVSVTPPASPATSAAPAPASAAAPASTDSGATPPATAGDSVPPSPEDANLAKRLSDTQRALHSKAEEAAQLRKRLDEIARHPSLGPVADPASGTPTADAPDPELDAAWERYTKAPDDKTAFRLQAEYNAMLAEKRTRASLEKQARDAENAQRAQQRQMHVKSTITKTVQQIAPDVEPQDFWAYSMQAQMETPAEILDPFERIEWQIDRAISIVRERNARLTQSASTVAAEKAAMTRSAGAVMPGGNGAGVVSPVTPAAKPLTFAEQAATARARIA